MTSTITPFLIFQDGSAEEAMRFYASLFDDAQIEQITRYGPGGDGPEGSVEQASFRLCGQRFRCFNSPVPHAFGFTPAISFFVTCQSEEEVTDLFKKLSEGGEVLMPLDTYPFSKKFGWLNDRFGVSWQVSLASG